MNALDPRELEDPAWHPVHLLVFLAILTFSPILTLFGLIGYMQAKREPRLSKRRRRKQKGREHVHATT